jgi:hypothetical protein
MLNLVAALVLAAGLISPASLSYVHETRAYDSFGILSHNTEGSVWITSADQYDYIDVNLTAMVSGLQPGCRLILRPNLPDPLSPEIELLEITPGVQVEEQTNLNPVTQPEYELTSPAPPEELSIHARIRLNGNGTEPDERFLNGDDLFFEYEQTDPPLGLIGSDTESTIRNAYYYTMDNAQGVCLDHTEMLVSVLRSLNIPAKAHASGDHAWAEVCFDQGNGMCKWEVLDPYWGEATGKFISSDSDHKYRLSLDLETACENTTIEEDEVWSME